MQRYAVLLDVHDRDLRPIALVTEHDDAVRVHFAVDCGLRNTYREPYEVTEPDGTTVRYVPGETEYFGSVINTLSRGFAINELAQLGRLDNQTIAELYVEKVVVPRAHRRVQYAPTIGVYSYAVEEPARAPAFATAERVDLLCRAA